MTDLDYQLYVINARKPMLEAAGLWSNTYNAMQVLILANVVMDNPEVWRLSSLPDFKIIDDPEEAPCAFTTDWVELFAAMGPRGRSEAAQPSKSSGTCSPRSRIFAEFAKAAITGWARSHSRPAMDKGRADGVRAQAASSS